jgi:NADH-quinone oxidoreductase subunit F
MFNPHIVIEGMAIAAYAMGVNGRLQLHPRRDLRGLRALRGSARGSARRRLPRRTHPRLDWNFQLHACHGFGAYICGEETALLESLEGKKGQPRFKPPFPASFGLYGKPTTINNTETFAAVP